MAKKENKEIKKAIDIIDEMSMDEKEWELYMSRKFAIMDYNTGMRNAREEGKKVKQIAIAKTNLIQYNKGGNMVKHTEKRLPLTSDIVFKRVFSKEGNEDILKSLLEAILKIPSWNNGCG